MRIIVAIPMFGNLHFKVCVAINKLIFVVVELPFMIVHLFDCAADPELVGDTNLHEAVLDSIPCKQTVAELCNNANDAVEDKTDHRCVSNKWPANEEIEQLLRPKYDSYLPHLICNPGTVLWEGLDRRRQRPREQSK